MPTEKSIPRSTVQARSSGVDVLRLQLEANEQLVLAALRAHEQADEALGAQRRAEEEADQVRAREEELRATAEFRERLLSIIGHDLRSPLSTILLSGARLIQHGDLTEADAEVAKRIVSSGERMARMIDQLVDFARARLGGGFALRLAPIDLRDVCQDIADELRVSSSTEIQLTFAGDLAGTWDADRLAEVISNVAGNALEHATPGTPVLIHAEDDGPAVIAKITNQGVCIPPDLLPAIFKAFRRADKDAETRTGHLGLGLYIASEIVRAHGGTIDVLSSDGSTSFTIRLPRVQPLV